MRKIRFAYAAIALALVATAGVASAQNRNIPIPASSVGGSGVAAVAVRQLTEADVNRIVGSTGSGATVLPFRLPSGIYRNAAPYPLSLNAGVGNDQGGFITVNGQTVANVQVRDSGTWVNMTGIVPAGATFEFRVDGRNGNTATVTAMSNGATWPQTGIRFAVNSGVYVATPVDAAPEFRNVFDCRFASYDTEYNMYYVNVALFDGSPCDRRAWTLYSHLAGYLRPNFVANTNFSTARYAYGGAIVRGVYSRNVNEGRGVCNAELRQGDNWGTTTTTWSGQFPYPAVYTVGTVSQEFTRDACIPSVIENIRNTGLPYPPPPPPHESF